MCGARDGPVQEKQSLQIEFCATFEASEQKIDLFRQRSDLGVKLYKEILFSVATIPSFHHGDEDVCELLPVICNSRFVPDIFKTKRLKISSTADLHVCWGHMVYDES